MNRNPSRRNFIKTTGLAGMYAAFGSGFTTVFNTPAAMRRVGIIGLDTSHATEFIKALNSTKQTATYNGYYVSIAYPYGSRTIESSYSRIGQYTKEAKENGVTIAGSIDELLRNCDVVLLETNDGALHLEQATKVFKSGKKVFIDKPAAARLADVISIYKLARQYNTPMFSASSLRFIEKAQQARNHSFGKVLGASTFSPAKIEASHTDLFWYGIHGVELLYTVMGTGCVSVSQTATADTDVVVGTWADGRVGVFRGTRNGKHDYGGIVHAENATVYLDRYDGYVPLLKEIIKFFETGTPPVSAEETLEIYAFMDAAAKSKASQGRNIPLAKTTL
ncbi:Gfo/Idh/MocA family oxidoreductase [Niabella pedocola]|uniref:Gfo/Idh/MocA family oxidoreductase n=1 Tax=Niabella pedocola TaxID=1752077 RepID=A0ABS8PN57_9BACT|nr:Gfo/Idh/MocA family oxidoreductase [Niabella pedocola]MCD2422461.1 Gfo/Idh/MocA family oxidoreductase [Niabella pedocola]